MKLHIRPKTSLKETPVMLKNQLSALLYTPEALGKSTLRFRFGRFELWVLPENEPLFATDVTKSFIGAGIFSKTCSSVGKFNSTACAKTGIEITDIKMPAAKVFCQVFIVV